LKELPTGAALLPAGSQNRPDTSVPLSAHQRAAAMCNPSVNNRLAKGLLGSVVSWGHSRVKQEPKHRITMLAKAFRNRLDETRLSVESSVYQSAYRGLYNHSHNNQREAPPFCQFDLARKVVD